MGSSGVRRRKRTRPLPPPRDWSGYDNPPGMMWHEGPTDFEPSPYSPAGRALIGWRMTRSLAWGGRHRRRWIRVAFRAWNIALLTLLAWGLLSPVFGYGEAMAVVVVLVALLLVVFLGTRMVRTRLGRGR